MPEGESQEFIVCADTEPVVVKINGKANYLNCSPINDFFEHILNKGVKSFLVDFSNCRGMDSTFLGVLAGVATRTMQHNPLGEVLFINLSTQNKQLIRGLGLHHLPTVQIKDDVVSDHYIAGSSCDEMSLETEQEASPDMILQAHERLMKLNRANERRFQDVVKFLRREAEKPSQPSEES